MFTLIEALDFRCLRDVRRPLGRFHPLVGPNASGKTTFLDVVSFLGTLVSKGVEEAVFERTPNFEDLVFGRDGDRFQLAVEATIPTERRERLAKRDAVDTVRYEVEIGLEPAEARVAIRAERVLLKAATAAEPQKAIFPALGATRANLLIGTQKRDSFTVVNKVPGGNDNFYSEVYKESGKGWVPTFKLGPYRSALGNLPADERAFPVAMWLKDLLTNGVQSVVLNSLAIRKPSPPGRGFHFRPDGSNLPWVIEQLRDTHPDRFESWLDHVRTALTDLESLRTIERPEDRHRYLMLRYRGGLEIPSWMASDGTLRLLALTLPAYLPRFEGVYLIEEPENGIHPKAVESVVQSLGSVYDAQILAATHSPVVLSAVEPAEVLCFAKTPDGATDIVSGDEHPALASWQGEVDLGSLFAGGVLG